ncbi:DUF1214 domain-containing protein [Sphingobium sp. CAP-1]|uniref:DUF1214 domain-containing protein n=1 Tax=Sphingobium sp. CAP-1 TaxID=2676077 RepID=UPI0012BB3BCF|nr:DUF1214 domain-containing protein [Sphingobium sp. CAP-1]QGP80507.1 DUF1214 domain-containing protein [Sphingobium sp. CAP-1]
MSAGEMAATRLLSGAAWDDFCDTLKVAGRMIDRFGDQPSDLDRAEYYRFLSRLARSSLERLVENAEPTRPRLRDMVWRQSINFQTVDQDHLMCQFDEARDYRITGTRGTIPYFILALLTAPAPADPGAQDWAPLGVEGLAGFDPSNLKTTAFLASQQLAIAQDGTFEIILSQNDPGAGKNWLKLAPDTNCILIRLVWSDRASQTAPALTIERMDGATPEPLTPALMANNLAWAAQGVLGYAELVRNWWQGNQGNFAAKLNRLDFSRAQYLSNGGVPDRHVAFGGWEKRLDEALVLEFTPPPCEYWNFQICNIWQENLDTFEDGNGWVSNYRHIAEPDGRVRIIIAEKDPGAGGNWVNSFGHDKGQWGLRFVQTQQTPPVKLWRLPLARLESEGAAALNPAEAVDTGQFVD